MMTGEGGKIIEPDWRDAKAYAHTSRLTRLQWAWEFLRRNPEFQVDLAHALEAAELIESSSAVTINRSMTDLSRWGVMFRGLV